MEIAHDFDNGYSGDMQRKSYATNNKHEGMPRQLLRMLLGLPILMGIQSASLVLSTWIQSNGQTS